MKKIIGSVLAFFLMAILIFSLASYLTYGSTSSNLTFIGFLNYLAGAPNIELSWMTLDLTIYADWGVFNFLRSFLNFFTDIFEVLLFVFGLITKGLGYIIYFVHGLFVI